MNGPIVQVEHMTKQFGTPDGQEFLLPGCHDISLNVGAGLSIGIVGESGSGKTTLGRCIAGLTEINGGAIRHNGLDIGSMSRLQQREFRRAVQVVFQNPETALNPRMTVGRFVAEALRNFNRCKRSEEHEQLVAMAALVGLNESHLARYPHQLSGGQKQRVGVMRALACAPDLIVLDEPTSALDVSVQAQVLRTLKEIQASTSVAYILISHDVGVIRAMCDQILVMYLGRVVEKGPTEKVLSNPAHPYTRALIDAVPRVHRQVSHPFALRGDISARGVRMNECPLRRRCPLAIDRCRQLPPESTVDTDHHVSCWRSAELDAYTATNAAGGS